MLEEDADHSEHDGESLPPGERVEDVRALPGHPQGLRTDALGRATTASHCIALHRTAATRLASSFLN